MVVRFKTKINTRRERLIVVAAWVSLKKSVKKMSDWIFCERGGEMLNPFFTENAFLLKSRKLECYFFSSILFCIYLAALRCISIRLSCFCFQKCSSLKNYLIWLTKIHFCAANVFFSYLWGEVRANTFWNLSVFCSLQSVYTWSKKTRINSGSYLFS